MAREQAGEAGASRQKRTINDFLPESVGGTVAIASSDFPLPSPGPVGGRLGLFSSEWTRLCTTDNWVLNWLTTGLTWRWRDQSPSLRKEPWAFALPTEPAKVERLHKEVTDLLQKGAIEEVPSQPGWFSLIFLVPKKLGGWRPVFDLSSLNNFLVIPKFRMESALSIQRSLKQGQWVISIDVKDAYLHIPIRSAYRKYLMFAYRGKTYRFTVLPFGLATAPYVLRGWSERWR